MQDCENLSRLIRTLSRRFITGAFSARGEEFLLDTMTPAAIQKLMQDGYRYHVAVVEGSVVGVIAMRDNRHLYSLFVAESHQRQGIARKLWQVAMEACLIDGNEGEFTVNSSEYAQEVYKRLGFVVQPGPRIKNGVVFYPMSLQVDQEDRV
mgnify:FL=1